MKLKLLVLVLALQTAWILGTTFVQETGLRSGNVVLLETMPVDPRDLLRGDYVILNYKISTIPTTLFRGTNDGLPPEGTAVYVGLVKRGQFHEVSRAAVKPFSPEKDEVVMKGTVQPSWNGQSSIRLIYGLERYYVAEGTGNPQGKLTVQVAVPKSGQGLIKQVFIDGKPYAEVMKQFGH